MPLLTISLSPPAWERFERTASGLFWRSAGLTPPPNDAAGACLLPRHIMGSWASADATGDDLREKNEDDVIIYCFHRFYF